jgi:hypothetical protein
MPTDAAAKGIAPPSLSPRPAVFARYDPNAADPVFGQSGHRHSIILVGSARVLASLVTRRSRRGLTSAVQAPHATLDLLVKSLAWRQSATVDELEHQGIIFATMRHVWFLVRLPFCLIAEAFLWLVAFAFGRLILLSGRKSEVVEKHKRLVDWLWGVPSEFRFRTRRDRFD